MAEVCSPLRLPLIAGHKKPAAVTEDVCRPMLRSPSALWWAGFAVAFSLLLLGVAAVSYQIATGVGTWGLNTHRRLGIRHHELRLLGRHRTRGHADFGHSVSVPPEVADFGESVGRSDDPVRGDVRRHFPHHPHGPPLAGVLAVPLSELPRFAVDQLPFAAGLGLLRDLDILPDLGRRSGMSA